MNKDVTYMKENLDLQTHYTVEYITEQKKLDEVNSGKHPAPWELYTTKEYDSMSEALACYLLHLFSDALDILLLEEIYINGESVREAYIEFEGTTYNYISKYIDKDNHERRVKAEERVDMLSKEVENFGEFLKIAPKDVKAQYKQFLQIKAENEAVNQLPFLSN